MKKFSVFLMTVLSLFLLVGFLGLTVPAAALAETPALTITGNGVTNTQEFTLPQLEAMEQYQHVYSTINTWPTKKWCVGKGVKLRDLLNLAGLEEDAKVLKFIAKDGFVVTLTVEELLNSPRYYFPHLMDNHPDDGSIPGSSEGAEAVEPILALVSVEGSDNPAQMDSLSSLRLIFGQRAVTEQTCSLFAKYVNQIVVLTTEPEKWDNPQANPEGGIVPAGTMVELSNARMDEDKIYYTTDGSTPDLNSPIYNWIASRWWSTRQDDLYRINHPIEITGDTIIKAVTIGPGKKNSDVVTFTYQVSVLPPPQLRADLTDNAVGSAIELTFEDDAAWRAAITGVSVNGSPLAAADYLVEAGKLTIKAGVIRNPGDYNITVQATGYREAGVLQTILPGLKIPPELTADTVDNIVGKAIELTFEDDAAWRAAITGVSVDGEVLDAGKYSLETSIIIINADVFKKAGDYIIVVQATGYLDTVVTQTIRGNGGTTDPGGDVVLTITGDGVNTPKTFTLAQLQGMEQYQHVYSAINTWPSKKWYVGKGVRLRELLNSAGLKGSAKQIKFTSRDGYTVTLTVQELLGDKRYYFPQLKANDPNFGHIPGSPLGAEEVEPVLALVSAEGTDNPAFMNDMDALLLMLGQRAVTEQNGHLFTKYVEKIEVLTADPGTWDKPKAEPGSGSVSAGTLVKLSNNNNDADKIHYTTDGSAPTMESPMYNWIASRWWTSRADELDSINQPIEIKKNTTIKAITIGPGKKNSDIATFTYTVTGGTVDISDRISPFTGGTISLGKEAVIEIPAGALAGIAAVEVKIEKVTTPPAAPEGFKLAGGVFEFSVDGKYSYNFNKEVTIKLGYDPEAVSEGDTPAIHYYDEAQSRWVNIGGTVSGASVAVQVDHFTKFAVMAADQIPVAAGKISPLTGGTISLDKEAVIEIPAGALAGTAAVEVKIEKVATPPAAPKGFKLAGGVYEFSVDGKYSYNFNKEVTIKLGYDPEAVSEGETPAIHYYDEVQSRWVNIGGTVSGASVVVQVDHFTKFAVMAAVKEQEQTLTDITGHWAYEMINKLVGMGCISGYPDGTFKPDNTITRAEFAVVLVKAFGLENKGGAVFNDTAGHWAEGYIETAASNGIVNGYDGGAFGPDDLITREQLAVMLVRAAELTPVAEEIRFADSGSISAWAVEGLTTAVGYGIIKGYPDQTVRPGGSATRAEAVTVIVNTLNVLNGLT
jgi:hypothetical protein